MLVILSALFSLVSGLIVLWANPRRFPNQVFSITGGLLAVWFGFIYLGNLAGPQTLAYVARNFPWHRANAAVAAFFPWSIWLLKDAVVAAKGEERLTILRSLPWFALGGFLVVLAYSDSFVFFDPRSNRWERGTSYFVYNGAEMVACACLVIQAGLQLRIQTGLRRIEMRFLALNIGIAWLLMILSAALGNLLHTPAIKGVIFFVALGAFVLAGWSITTHRVYDARQIFLALAQRVFLALAFSLVIFGLWRSYDKLDEQRPISLFVTVALCGSAAFWLDRKSREWLDLSGEQNLTATRRAVIGLSRTEFHPDELITRFEALFREQCRTSLATLLFDRADAYAAGKIEFRKDRPGFAALCENGWITPESLQRRRSTPGLADLQRFLAEHSLGLMVVAPQGSQKPSLLLALGTKTTQWPFTYPEVRRLQNLAELMDSILTRSRLTAQAAQQARMEYLALISRGLAHDLKNLITPISSFLIHTDDRFAAGSPEAEVHAAARRSARIMTDYVRETLFFSERLAPKCEQVDLRKIFGEVRELTSSLALRRGVALTGTPEYEGPFAADAVLIQRVLANLVGNALDASATGQTVILSATAGRPGWVRLQVVDHGCGIPPENLPRIFDPYFTTKEFGDDVRGFGLGLTICQKIVHLHGGTIVVHSELARGTAFTVDLPATPPTAAPRIDAGSV